LEREILILCTDAGIPNKPGAIRERDHTPPPMLPIKMRVNIGKTAKMAHWIAPLHAGSEKLGHILTARAKGFRNEDSQPMPSSALLLLSKISLANLLAIWARL
jgi:hypothetical protein